MPEQILGTLVILAFLAGIFATARSLYLLTRDWRSEE